MKTRHQLLIGLVLTLMLVTSSCSVQKRRYRKGYYVSWNKNYTANHQIETKALNVIKEKKISKVISLDADSSTSTIVKKKEIVNVKEIQNSKINSSSPTHLTIDKQEITLDSNQIEIVTDSTKIKITNEEVKKEDRINNKALSSSTFLIMASIKLFILGGFIGLIIGYFLAIKAINQIRDNPDIYKENSEKDAKIIIYAFIIFFLIAFIILLILTFIEPLTFVLTLMAAFYLLIGIIGLIIMHHHKKRISKEKTSKKNKTGLVLFLIAVLLFISLPFYTMLF